ncbi:MAG: hypothetical protein D6725_15980, partial [Planctomycetota bacterium]
RLIGSPDPENKNDPFLTRPVHPGQVQQYVRQQLEEAYRLLKRPEYSDVWSEIAGDELAKAIRNIHKSSDGNNADKKTISKFRECFFNKLKQYGNANWYDYEVRGVYAWAILVHATLLNERLRSDIKRVLADRECSCSVDPELLDYLDFHHPQPTPQAAEVFREYVRCKWPIRVFALDPVTQEQNIADIFSMTREMQLAVALAFATGQINLEDAAKFMRRFELDMQTVALNRTVVAFGHGSDTFGWRFYPRVQTPDEEGNLTVAFRDLFLGRQGKDARLKQQRIEPGMRECAALVVMPSFVPYVRFDARGSWFKLTDPDHTRSDLERSLRWSRLLRQLKDLEAYCYQEADLYHSPHLIRQLRKRVTQLERRLPLQTVDSPIPLAHLPCGATLFANGSADLAPELHYWVGLQGINAQADTDLILAGANFSVLETRVIVGDREIPQDNVQLISREILRIRVPRAVAVQDAPNDVTGDGKGVNVYVATPYGITPKLFVPVFNTSTSDSCATEPFTWATPTQEVTYVWTKNESNKENLYAIADTGGIKIPESHEIRITAPPCHLARITASTAELTGIQVELENAETFPQFLSIKANSRKLEFDAGENQLVLRGTEFEALHQDIKTAFLKRLNGQKPPKDPPGKVTLKLTAAVSLKVADNQIQTVPVSDALTIRVRTRHASP